VWYQLRERNVLASGNGRIENEALHLKLVLAVQALGRVFVKAKVDCVQKEESAHKARLMP
jgi:hypothetical protein